MRSERFCHEMVTDGIQAYDDSHTSVFSRISVDYFKTQVEDKPR